MKKGIFTQMMNKIVIRLWIVGLLLAVPAKAEKPNNDESEKSEVTKSQDCDYPRNVVKMDVGPSWIVSEVQTPRNIYKSKTGIGLGIDYQHLWRNGLGIGVNYLFFATNFSHDPMVEDLDMRMHYIGPSFVESWRWARKWRADSSVGVGFSSCIETSKILNWHYDNELATEYSVGIFGQLGIEYMFSKSVGIGMQYQGLFMPMKEPKNNKRKYDVYGIKRIDAKIGIRFYL